MKLALVLIVTHIIIAYIATLLVVITQNKKIKALRKAYDKISVELTEKQIKLQEENDLLKKKIEYNPIMPIEFTTQKLKEIRKEASINSMPSEETDRYLRCEVLTEVAPLIKIFQNPITLKKTATLLIVDDKDEDKCIGTKQQ